MKEKTRMSPFDAEMEKFPSKSEIVPTVVPLRVIFAPVTGNGSSEALMLPVMFQVCANNNGACKQKRNKKIFFMGPCFMYG